MQLHDEKMGIMFNFSVYTPCKIDVIYKYINVFNFSPTKTV